MADEAPVQEEQTTPTQQPEVATVPTWKVRLAIAAFVAALIGAECVLAFVLLPSRGDLEAMIEAHRVTGRTPEEILNEASGESKVNEKKTVEVELGDFDITTFHPGSEISLRISFKLVGTVLDGDQSAFGTSHARYQHLLRDQISTIMRSSDMEDLNDPALALIKRKILERVNRTLGKVLLQEVIFSEYAVHEQ